MRAARITDDEFQHRLEVLKTIGNDLAKTGVKQVRIKSYTGETFKEQRANPVFGLNQYAS